MFEFIEFLTSAQVVTFLLLFVRVTTLFVFLPFFSSEVISVTVKPAVAFYITLFLYPMVPVVSFELLPSLVMTAVLMEIVLGFAVGLLLRFAFASIQYAGELIAFVMGFSMATAIDPQSAVSMPLISNFLNMLAIMAFLLFDGHHLLLMFMSASLHEISLGGFVLTDTYFEFAMQEMARVFVMGFVMAFPIIALSLLSDIIFGMIMKTMPSFNLMVVGFPAKIAIAFAVLIAILGSMIFLFKEEFLRTFELLSTL